MNPRSRYGWMVLGGLLCLFGVVVVCKCRDSSVARAQTQALPPIDQPKVEIPPPKMDLPEKAPALTPPPANDVMLPPPVLEKSEIQPASGTVPAPPSQPPLGDGSRPILIPSSGQTSAPPPVKEVSAPPPVSPVIPPPESSGGQSPPPIKAEEKAPPPVPVTPVRAETVKDHHNEPPLAPAPGPVVTYRLSKSGETFRSLAKKTLNSQDRWSEIHKLNPSIRADAVLVAGTVVRLPADACVSDDADAVRQLPSLKPRPTPRPRAALPLTGTYPLTLDDKHGLTLPQSILTQLGNCDTVLLSPGCDRCLWLTNQAHLDRMAAKLDKSSARESDVQGFKRLYYAQTVKVAVKDGRIVISDRLAQFAGLHQELVLVGIDDHFELWDAAKWRTYTHANKSKTEE